ncbi:MAG: polysaccharide deacetylase family protein [Pirellulales bacterium]
MKLYPENALRRLKRNTLKHRVIRQAFRTFTGTSVLILMYHGVTSSQLPINNWCQVDAALFSQQIGFTADTHEILHLDDVLTRLANGQPIPRRTACLTFDDGFRNIATTAHPVLLRHAAPHTIFLVTESILTGQPAWPDRLFFALANTQQSSIDFQGQTYSLIGQHERESAYIQIATALKSLPNQRRIQATEEVASQIGLPEVPKSSPFAPMDQADLGRLQADPLTRFGSHTHSHPILSQCPIHQRKWEIELAHRILLDFGLHPKLFAYPNGRAADLDPDSSRILRQLGYYGAVTTIHGLNRKNSDPFRLYRVGVGRDMTMPEFEVELFG